MLAWRKQGLSLFLLMDFFTNFWKNQENLRIMQLKLKRLGKNRLKYEILS